MSVGNDRRRSYFPATGGMELAGAQLLGGDRVDGGLHDPDGAAPAPAAPAGPAGAGYDLGRGGPRVVHAVLRGETLA